MSHRTTRERILFVIPSLAGGGAERVVSLLTRELTAEYDVHLAVFSGEAVYEHGGVLHDLAVPLATGGIRSALWFMLRATLGLRRLKAQLAPRACVSFMELANFCNVLSGGASRVIISVRTIPSMAIPASINGRLARSLVRRLYPRADKVIAISEGAREDLVRNFAVPNQNVDVIYNPLSAESLKVTPVELLPPQLEWAFEGPTIVAVGRLAWEKGHVRLIRAFAALRSDHQGVTLVIVGQGPLRAKLVAEVRSLGLKSWSSDAEESDEGQRPDVVFAGFQEQPMAFLRRSTVFAFPSHHEGLGQALLEALAAGVPVIASDCRSGPRELLAPGTPSPAVLHELEFAQHGILAPKMPEAWPEAGAPFTVEEREWARGLSALLRDDEFRQTYGIAARQRAEQFVMDVIARQWKKQLDRKAGDCA